MSYNITSLASFTETDFNENEKTEKIYNITGECASDILGTIRLQEKKINLLEQKIEKLQNQKMNDIKEKNYQEMIRQFPHLDKEDVKRKCFKNVGLYITWVEDKDKVNNIEFPRNWCAGATALHLTCQEGADEVYMLGFDLSDYDEPINNIYKGTDNYLSSDSKGFNTDEWVSQLIQVFKEFDETQFYWVVKKDASPLVCNNVQSITYKDLDKRCQI